MPWSKSLISGKQALSGALLMRRLVALLGFLALVLSASHAWADEGMWLYNAFPKEKVKATYGFEPTQAWLDHLRLSSVRFNNGGSGSFVSANGLTFTNHHVGAECVQELSSGGKDYIKNGFYARNQSEEAKCPNLELNQLVGIEDVTAKVNAGVKAGMSAAEAGQAQRAAMADVEKQCATSTGLRCDVITLYSGEVYDLYKYKKYTDVRLVFAPEFEMAFFGGDPDNFTYPRYDLDITFFRVYENDKPAHLENYLEWSKTGVNDGELIFVSGNPGSTGRLRTISQLDFLRDVDYPSRLDRYARRIAVLRKFSAESSENARTATEDIFGLQNSQKAITGYLSGLKDPELMDRKKADEEKLRAEVASNAKLKAETGDPWDAIRHAMEVQEQIYPALTYVERREPNPFSSTLANIARHLVRAGEERTKPNGERLREYRDSALASLEQQMFSSAPIYKPLETVLLAENLTETRDALGSDNPIVRKMLNGKSPDELAQTLIDGTKLEDIDFRKQLYQGGAAAVEASTDPLIVFMRTIDPDARAVRKQYDDEVDSVERTEGAKIARAQFSAHGFTTPPDATFTLRLSYGAVKGYVEDGKQVPFETNIGGAYQHAEEHGNQPPYQLPESWMNAKAKLNLGTPLNFVSTADIIGGNSGSPTVNQAGEVVGIIFDGNLQSLPWNFLFSDKQGRAISVDSRGIIEALRNVYGANALADELTKWVPRRKVQRGEASRR
jgi:Peptidase S46